MKKFTIFYLINKDFSSHDEYSDVKQLLEEAPFPNSFDTEAEALERAKEVACLAVGIVILPVYYFK